MDFFNFAKPLSNMYPEFFQFGLINDYTVLFMVGESVLTVLLDCQPAPTERPDRAGPVERRYEESADR